eukprot:scaffold156136_cov53-Attheya_sp.AAC.5
MALLTCARSLLDSTANVMISRHRAIDYMLVGGHGGLHHGGVDAATAASHHIFYHGYNIEASYFGG